MHVGLGTQESGRILALCYDVTTRTEHGVTLSAHTRAAEIEKKHVANALKRSLVCMMITMMMIIMMMKFSR